MKKALKFINKPIVIIATLISAVAVVLAKFFMTQECCEKDKKSKDEK